MIQTTRLKKFNYLVKEKPKRLRFVGELFAGGFKIIKKTFEKPYQ